MKTKLLLYCTKGKPYLKKCNHFMALSNHEIGNDGITLNGKIVAECECEVEEILKADGTCHFTESLSGQALNHLSKLNDEQLCDYLGYGGYYSVEVCGYALHLTNIKVFDKPNNLESCVYFKNTHESKMSINRSHYEVLHKAPKNAMRVIFNKEEYILLSASPTEMCNILNGKQTIIVRKKVLKGMM